MKNNTTLITKVITKYANAFGFNICLNIFAKESNKEPFITVLYETNTKNKDNIVTISKIRPKIIVSLFKNNIPNNEIRIKNNKSIINNFKPQ